MKSLFSLILLTLLLSSFGLVAQGTAINETGASPDASSILDVSSDTKGVLIPRMNAAARTGIAAPAIGLVVYDTDSSSFWYRAPSGWVELTDNQHGLRDADGDTQVQVEESPDEDIIRFDIGGIEGMVLEESTAGATRLSISPDTSLIIGHNAGVTSEAARNTLIGYEAGQNNTTGNSNVFLGFRAGKNNGATQSRNVIIGCEAGLNNNAGLNTLIGYQAGLANTDGTNNTFLGYTAGLANTTGYKNTFIGFEAGFHNQSTHNNTLIGTDAGYNNVAGDNTFVGKNAGYVNRLGTYNTVVGNDAAGNLVIGRELGNSNSILGYQAGYWSIAMAENTLMGYRSGYSMTTGANNVLLGFQAGYNSTTARANVSVGSNALRLNATGNYNVAAGDSALYNNVVSNNVAIGRKAGMSNTTGGSNTFVGTSAGLSNSTGGHNVMMGTGAGQGSKSGGYNVFVGAEAATSNVAGELNTILGYASGFRNTNGNKNIFIGNRAAEYNINGSSNIGIGTSVLTQNSNGSYNIGIGESALGNAVQGEGTSIASNIGIGKNAGFHIVGSSNIIIGNESGLSMDGQDNVLLGNSISPHGTRNTYLGTNTSGGVIQNPTGATAIGYGTAILQDYSVIVGDPTNMSTKVGIGTALPTSWLHIDGHGTTALRVTQNGSLALSVNATGKVIADHELLVNTTLGKPGYQMSVDGSIACEEVLVQLSEAWPDYVFAEDYPLMDMGELKTFLQEKKHLPGIPSAAQVAATGIQVGDMQKRLVEKIEELTLYILDLETRLQTLENK